MRNLLIPLSLLVAIGAFGAFGMFGDNVTITRLQTAGPCCKVRSTCLIFSAVPMSC